MYHILVFLQTVSQKVGREGQWIILGMGRYGNNTPNPEKCSLLQASANVFISRTKTAESQREIIN